MSSDKKKADASSDEPVSKKAKTEESKDGVSKIEPGKESAMEAEVRAARERAVIPLEIRMKQFRDMLQEKEVGDCYIFYTYLLVVFRLRS